MREERQRRRRTRRAAPPSAPPVAAADGAGTLLAKYRALCAKYEDLTARRSSAAHEHASDVSLALYAVRASATGYAVVRDGVLAGRNPRFAALARILGWTPVEGGERHGTLPELVLAKAAGVRRGGTRFAGRWRAGGSAATYELRLERVDAKPPVVVVTVQDVSDQLRAERELAKARQAMADQERMRMVGELASGIAHDLNNTLHAIALRLERLRRSPAVVAAQGANLDALLRIVTAAGARIARVQDLARTRDDAPTEPVDVCRAIADAVEIVRPDLDADRRPGAAPFTVEASLREAPLVLGDAAELRHVFLNLLVNARDAMPRGGRVSIDVEASAREVVVRVSDEGHGISPEHLPRLFHPFFTTKGQRGTGLGLSIAAGVMRRLGGSIAAANRREGGAVFTLAFPVAGEAAAARPRSAPAHGDGEPDAAAVRALRVLVVDDDADSLEATQLFLEERCGVADAAPSGAAALARFEGGERWDVVLCDIGMPGMSGWDVAARLRSVAPEMPVFLLSGWAHEIARDDPRRELVAGLLPKPLETAALDALLGEVAHARPPSHDRQG